jgi:hypothetical protein
LPLARFSGVAPDTGDGGVVPADNAAASAASTASIFTIFFLISVNSVFSLNQYF